MIANSGESSSERLRVRPVRELCSSDQLQCMPGRTRTVAAFQLIGGAIVLLLLVPVPWTLLFSYGPGKCLRIGGNGLQMREL